jgi:serine/threonine protein kinase
MHRKNIIHRDIKPDNILILDKGSLQVCITDLGLACRADDQNEIYKKCGTPGYVAPEIFENEKFTDKSDIFSLGSLLFNIVTGKSLFKGRNTLEIL